MHYGQMPDEPGQQLKNILIEVNCSREIISKPTAPVCFLLKLVCFEKESNVQPVQLPVVRLVSNAAAFLKGFRFSPGSWKVVLTPDSGRQDL